MARALDDLFSDFVRDARLLESLSPEELVARAAPDVDPARGATDEERARRRFAVPDGPRAPDAAPELRHIPYEHGRYHAMTVAQVQELVHHARRRGVALRVAGAGHSVGASIHGAPSDLRVILAGELRSIAISRDAAGAAIVDVGAGCYLGVNPSDPSSRLENSLVYFLDRLGHALPTLGGITHQSVGGFLQTSSSGGSLRHGFADVVEEIELVDGRGEVLTLRGDDLAASAVAMGLHGVVTRVRLRPVPAFLVEGTEANCDEQDSLLAGGARLADALLGDEYLHLNWFPQKYVRRVMTWRGQGVAPGTATIVPYENTLRQKLVATLAALVLKVSNGILAVDPDSDVFHRFTGALLRKFLPLDRPQQFCDHWYRALPSDDQVDVDRLIKTYFTEIWLPREATERVLDILGKLYRDQAAAGNFAVEIYGAKASRFWMSPAFERDVVRVDPYWWAHNLGRPEAYFTRFWDSLLGVPGARLHFGKYVPRPGQRCGPVTFDRAFLASRYPRLPDWLAIRAARDPDQLFVTDYWRGIFELPAPPSRPAHFAAASPIPVAAPRDDEGIVVDLHAHFPMSLDPTQRARAMRLLTTPPREPTVRDRVRVAVLDLASRLANYRSWDSGPAVTVEALRAGRVGVALSVLYSPFDEMDLAEPYGAAPRRDYFPTLLMQLEAVERSVRSRHAGEAEIATSPLAMDRALAAGRVALVHAVEGGFHVGTSRDEILANVGELARRGVAYITVAHLFFRQIASNVPSLPFLADGVYDALFPQPHKGLTELGKALIEGMVRDRILVDVTHMDETSMEQTFEIIDILERAGATGGVARVPVIASHMACRFRDYEYNLTDDWLRRIARTGGVMGVIFCDHYMRRGIKDRQTRTFAESVEVIYRQIDRIRAVTGSDDHVALGSDLDGFIKPTLAELDDASAMKRLREALVARYGPTAAEKMASGNALRVLRTYWLGA